jgi:hypothetical protein
MSLRQFISEQEQHIILEGKMEDELTSQMYNDYIKGDLKSMKALGIGIGGKQALHDKATLDGVRVKYNKIAKQILDLDPTRKKSWRFKIKEWLISGEIALPEDATMLTRDLTLHTKLNINKTDFKTRADVSEYIQKVKDNKGIVDEMFDYTFDIDHDDKQFTIYNIQEKDKREYISKLGQCTTWCISTDQMFGYYTLPYYLLVDKREKKQYAIVPSGGQFKDSKQNADNSEKKFEEFDRTLDLRNKYFFNTPPKNVDIMDAYIYSGPKFENAPLDIKVAVSGITNATINGDGTMDVNDDVLILDSHVENGKLKFKFGKVTGEFECTHKNLTSLEGFPIEVGKNCNCYHNKLTSLKGAPKKVGGDFACSMNQLTSLKGAPKEVGADFDCSDANLTSLIGAPDRINGFFDCRDNSLKTLEGGPSRVDGDFDCAHNMVTHLKGSPRYVGGAFDCSDNKLTSLEGAPDEVYGAFICDTNPDLKSLDGIGTGHIRVFSDFEN